MSAKNLKVALQITADLNNAKKEIAALKDEIVKTSKAADASSASQGKASKAVAITAEEVKKLSGATDLKGGINQLSQYETGLNKTALASKDVAMSNKMIESSIKSLTPHLMSLIGLSGGFIAIAVDTVNKAADLQRLSGLSGLDVEQFQYYAVGAKKVGVEQEKLADIFKDTREKVGDFIATGGGELADFFENIAPQVGITVEQFKKLNGKDALQLYVDSLQKAGVSQNEMVFYLEAIASDATLLLPLLNNGGEAWQKYGDAAKAAGAILGKETIDQALKAKEALGDFQNNMTGVANKLVSNAAPAIVFVAEHLDDLVRAGLIVASVFAGKMVSATAAATLSFIAGQIEAVKYQMALARMAQVSTVAAARLTALSTASRLLTLAGGLPGLAIAAAGVVASFVLMPNSTDDVTDSFNNQVKSVADLASEYQKLDAAQQRITTRDAIQKQEELSQAYALQKQNLSVLIEMGTRSNSVSEEQRKKALQLIESFNAGTISATTLATEYQKLNTIKASFRDRADEVAVATNNAKDALDKQNNIVDIYTGKTTSASSASADLKNNISGIGNAAKTSANDIFTLTEKLKELFTQADQNIVTAKVTSSLATRGYDDKLIAIINKYAQAQGAIIKDEQGRAKFHDEIQAKINEEYKAILQQDKALDARNNKEKERTKQLEQQKKVAEQVAKINSTVQKQAAKYNYAGLEQQNGLPQGLLAAISMQESRGNANAQSPVGALGAFQFMPATAKQYGLSDRTDVQASAKAAAKFLSDLFKQFNGDLDKTIMAYNAGASRVESGAAYRFKETTNYLKQVKKYRAGYLGLTGEDAQADLSKVDAAQRDYLTQLEQQQQNRIAIEAKYYSESEKLAAEHNAAIKEINNAGFDDATKTKLLATAEQDYQDKLTKRPEILKRISDSLPSLEQSWLRSTGQGLVADLDEVEQKWKAILNDLDAAVALELDSSKKAELMDYKIKIEAVIDKEQLTLRFNDAMKQLDDLQALRQQRQDNLKLQYESGQISQPQYAEGLRGIDSEMLPQLNSAASVAQSLAEALGDAFSIEKINNFVLGLTQIDTEFKKFLPTAEQLNERIAGGLTDAIMDFADGTKSAGDAFRQFASDFLREIAQMILKQMIFNAIGGSSGSTGSTIAGALSAAFGGFATGGYTGIGGKYEPAGIVHKGEVVWSQDDIKRWGGVSVVEAMRKFGGYADGGIVAAPNINIPTIAAPKLSNPTEQIAASTSFSANQQFLLVDDPSRLSDYIKSGDGQETIVVMMSRDPAKYKAALKIG